MSAPLPLVSIVMPIRNEVATIDRALDAIATQSYPADRIEIVVVDGRSTDGTTAAVTERIRTDPRITLIQGDYNCPAAMNEGIGRSTGDIVAKIDGHGYMNARFLEIGVRYLLEHPECACVGGVILPIGETRTARSNMYARFSKFGVGSGVYTSPHTVHETDTVQCGVYVKRHLEQVGAFDPDLQFGEDEEVNYRLVRAGFRVVFHPEMEFHYFVRPSFAALFRQYRNYGGARVKVLRKHPGFLRVKHLVPAAAILALAAGSAAALVSQDLRPPALGLLATYVSFVAVGAFWTGIRRGFYCFHCLFVSLVMLHFGYGLGMLREACRRGRAEAPA